MPDQHGSRRSSNEHPDRAMGSAWPIGDRVDRVDSWAQVSAGHEVVVGPLAARGIARSVDNSADEINKPSLGKSRGIAVEVPSDDPWTR